MYLYTDMYMGALCSCDNSWKLNCKKGPCYGLTTTHFKYENHTHQTNLHGPSDTIAPRATEYLCIVFLNLTNLCY